MAHRFLELGATVYICGRRSHVLAETEAELSCVAPNKIHSLTCDVRELPRVEEMIETIWKDGPLDILVNNAAGNFLARTEELSAGAFEAILGIVLMGTINVTMACGRSACPWDMHGNLEWKRRGVGRDEMGGIYGRQEGE